PGGLPCPDAALLTGRALDPLRNAVAYATNGQLDALTSIGNVPMALGQIVPFEMVIQASGGPGPERGTIDFTSTWSTYTTSNNRFGYDTNYMVYCAFVDAADPGSIDPNNNARVESYSSVVIHPGTIISALPPPQVQPPLGPLPPQPPVLPGATVNVINRTWRATDDCGNSSTCVQQFTVRDTTPPAIAAPPDVVLECPATDISTNVTG